MEKQSCQLPVTIGTKTRHETQVITWKFDTLWWRMSGECLIHLNIIFRITIRQDPTTDGVLAEMQILGAESSDAGAYFCQASNLYGKEQQLVNLHVQGKKSPQNIEVECPRTCSQ